MPLTAAPRWKEETVVTDEAGRTFIFDVGWGVTPPVVYVPPAADWTRCVPSWLADRRSEVIEVLEATGQIVIEGSYSVLEPQ